MGVFSCESSQKFKSVKIGDQIWMEENLNVDHYRNGDIIPQVQEKAEWAKLTNGAWCYYKNEKSNGVKYGKLYNWYAVNDNRGLAPKGWHIPSDEEWKKLSDILGGDEMSGIKMKSVSGWSKYEMNYGTNESGFNGLPGNFRNDDGSFYDTDGNIGFWWSSTSFDSDKVWFRELHYSGRSLSKNFGSFRQGLSIRCIKDK